MPMEKFAEYLFKKLRGGRIVEIGVGYNFKVALKLKEFGFDVIVVDWNKDSVKKASELGLKALVDNIFEPSLEVYKDVKAIYSVRPTPEMVNYLINLSNKLKVPLYILPFSLDEMPRKLKLENYKGLAIYKLER
jgi:hypothetical protein